jgi:hypothetical protein
MIAKHEAIEIARRFAEQNSWPWDSLAATAVLNTDVWCVATRVDDYWVENVYADVDANTGNVRTASFRPAVSTPISRERAMEIGRGICEQNGWSWRGVDIEEAEFESDDGKRLNYNFARCRNWCCSSDSLRVTIKPENQAVNPSRRSHGPLH